jgi:hypothetical protein
MAEFGDTTELEKTSLEAHVDLCAMRYAQVDQRLIRLEHKMDAVQKDITEGGKSLKITIIGAAATIASGILGVIVTILMKF